MKLKLLTISTLIVALALVWQSSSIGYGTDNGAGATGAPGETAGCSCHGLGGSYGTTVSVQVLSGATPIASYVPGTLYDVKITINNSAGTPVRRGFQAVCLKTSNNAAVNAFSNASAGVQFLTLAGRQYAEHNAPSVSNIFTFKWTAPAAGTGGVTLYAAGLNANNNNASSGDGYNKTSLALTEAVATAANDIETKGLELSIVGNPATEVLNLNLFANENNAFALQLVDALGRVVRTEKLSTAAGENQISVDIRTLPIGNYFVRVQSGAIFSIRQFIKI